MTFLFSSLARQNCIKLLLLIFAGATASSTPPSPPISPYPASTIMKDINEGSNATEPIAYKHVVFSDVDGTLVHYPQHLRQKANAGDANNDEKSNDGDDLIYLPPSKTGTRGVISTRTLDLCHRLRHGNVADVAPTSTSDRGNDEEGAIAISDERRRIDNGGVPFVLVSGMRTTTLFKRLPYLPRADAYACESGGRIFYPRPMTSKEREDDDGEDVAEEEGLVKGLVIRPISYPGMSSSEETPYSLVEDMHWRREMSRLDAAGPDGYDDACPVQQRKGKLWEFAQIHTQQGHVLDTSGYATAYRINRKYQPPNLAATFDDFLQKCANNEDIPQELGCSTNLGCVDVYPRMSGKKKCTEYLVQKFLRPSGGGTPVSLKTHATCMCDDDNDIEMALACRAAYLPSVTSESVRELVRETPEGGRLVVTEDSTIGVVETLATEAALEAIMGELA